MNPQKNPSPQQGGQGRDGNQQNRKDLPRYDDRPDTSKTGTANVAPDKPKQKSDLAGQTPTTLEQATGDPTRTSPKTSPRYGDQESDDPRRGTVEATDTPDASVEGSDKSGR